VLSEHLFGALLCANASVKIPAELQTKIDFRNPMIKTVEWTNEGVRMLDQRCCPSKKSI